MLALNLFLAVCCAVFDDVHEQIFAQAKRVLDREEGYSNGFVPNTGLLSVMNHITAATQQAMKVTQGSSENAKDQLMSSEHKYSRYYDVI